MSNNALPKMEHSFQIDVKGEETGQRFTGNFVYKRPNIRMDSEIDRTRALLDGGVANLNQNTKDLHQILATLRHTLTHYPDWWEEYDYGYELYDLNVVLDIYKETREFEAQFENKLHGENETSEGDGKSDQSQESSSEAGQ